MRDASYVKLAEVLDSLPNGFPPTESGVEIRLLKKIFTPEQAELFCDLKLTFETAAQIAERTGRPLEGLERTLLTMAFQGQLLTVKPGPVRLFRMLPWVFGIYEFQLGRMDQEFAELSEEYWPVYGREFFSKKPQLMQTLSVEVTIPFSQEALPYERVSAVIENGRSFLVNECICKKERGLVGKPCDRPVGICLAISPIPGSFDRSSIGRVVSKKEAYELLDKAEEAGLVHLTGNVQSGHMYICNCCKCCCGVLRSINEFGIPASHVINSYYHAVIDPEACTGCGICADERCQVGAIEETGDDCRVVEDRCIGCGLCIKTCPAEAIRMVRKDKEKITAPPKTEHEWFKERARIRGLNFDKLGSDSAE
jgi:electron transport complex protein RnfB